MRRPKPPGQSAIQRKNHQLLVAVRSRAPDQLEPGLRPRRAARQQLFIRGLQKRQPGPGRFGSPYITKRPAARPHASWIQPPEEGALVPRRQRRIHEDLSRPGGAAAAKEDRSNRLTVTPIDAERPKE